MIPKSKRKQLEDSGYSVSKSGKNVTTKNGGTVAGINDEGNFWGSGKAMAILKGEAKTDSSKSESKSTPKAKTSSSSTSSSKRPPKREPATATSASSPKVTTTKLSDSRTDTDDSSMSSGRGNGKAEWTRRKLDKVSPTSKAKDSTPESKSTSGKPFSGTSPTRSEWEAMSGMERIRWGVVLPPAKEGSSEGKRGDRARSRKMNMGGTVRKGSADYKNKGMFYKSESPRGYK